MQGCNHTFQIRSEYSKFLLKKIPFSLRMHTKTLSLCTSRPHTVRIGITIFGDTKPDTLNDVRQAEKP